MVVAFEGLPPADEASGINRNRRKSISATAMNQLLNQQELPASPDAAKSIRNNRRKSLSAVTLNLEIPEQEVGNLSPSPSKVQLSPDQLRQQQSLIKRYRWAVDEAKEWESVIDGSHPGLRDPPKLRSGGREVDVKDWNYYKSSWQQGSPGKSTAAWEDTTRIPLRSARAGGKST